MTTIAANSNTSPKVITAELNANGNGGEGGHTALRRRSRSDEQNPEGTDESDGTKKG